MQIDLLRAELERLATLPELDKVHAEPGVEVDRFVDVVAGNHQMVERIHGQTALLLVCRYPEWCHLGVGGSYRSQGDTEYVGR